MPHHTKKTKGSPARATADCQHRGNSIAERGDERKKGAEMREGISTSGRKSRDLSTGRGGVS